MIRVYFFTSKTSTFNDQGLLFTSKTSTFILVAMIFHSPSGECACSTRTAAVILKFVNCLEKPTQLTEVPVARFDCIYNFFLNCGRFKVPMTVKGLK